MDDKTLPAAHLAIRLARQEQMPAQEMLSHLVNGKISVPLSTPPKVQDGKILDWSPAIMNRDDGSRWLMAFTTPEMCSEYCGPDGLSQYYITVDTRWVLHTLPAGIGIAVNLNSEDHFEWAAEGVAQYKQDVLGW